MVPEGWNLKKLGEIATTASGSTPKRNIEEYWEGGSINWVATGEIDYKPIFESEEKITEKAVKDHSLTIFPKGSVLMAMYGQGTTRGKVGILATEAAINQNSCAILTNPLLTISEYIYYYLEISYTALRNLSNGGGQQNLNNQLVRSFEILLPPLPEQQKIADILSTWDKAIEKQEALIAAKQKRKRGLMQQLLTGKVRFKGFEGKWKRHKLKEVCEKSTPQINPSNFPQEEFEYYSIPAFQETGQPSKTLGEEIKSNKLLIESGVVLFGKLNPRILKIWKVESNSKARKLASTEFMPLIPSSTLNLSYLYYALHEPNFLGQVTNLVGGSTGSHQRINPKGFYNLSIRIPSLSEQLKIASVLSAADKEIETLETQLEAYKLQKRGLMQQLLTGKKRVKIKELSS